MANDQKDFHSEFNDLAPGTIIDRYMIERPLAGGGFSSVYLARQLSDQHQVAIKEYLPPRLAHRTWGNKVVPHSKKEQRLFNRGKRLFMEEAKVLIALKHPNIVEVLNFFSENSTVYLVMTYDYGKSLASYMIAHKGNLNSKFLLTVFPPLLEGIKLIHSNNLLHLDIKPDNVLVRAGGDPLLLDFGAVHPYPEPENMPGSLRGKLKVITSGFSPVEQYYAHGKIGPWSDIYAIGATMRACLDGVPPQPAPERQEGDTMVPASKAFREKYPARLLNVIDACMALKIPSRPQSVDDVLAELNAML